MFNQGMLRMLLSNDPKAMYDQMMVQNPQFKKFVEDNKDKSPEQIAQENGIDFNLVRNLLR